MQPVETELEDRAFRYTQVERHGDIAIYRQTHKQAPVDRYEVVRIRVRPTTTWPDGRVTPEHESYPGSSSWGADGWTFFALDAARAHAAQLREPAS